uniref:transposase n=1 Tax=Gilliamella sp. Nev6-6 TaxID=3120252 RepID=UPI00117B2F37|nr:transposase [Gilliamella apicola]
MNNIKRKRRTFNDDFKHQMVNLYQHGKSRSKIVAEFDLTSSTFGQATLISTSLIRSLL